MDNKEFYHNYSKIEWDHSNKESSKELEYYWMLKIKQAKREIEFNKKLYRKKVIIEKYL